MSDTTVGKGLGVRKHIFLLVLQHLLTQHLLTQSPRGCAEMCSCYAIHVSMTHRYTSLTYHDPSAHMMHDS